jgi:uncharacterized protein (DUF58 family)
VSQAAAPKLTVYGTLAALALLAALVFGRAELAALAAPFGLALFVGLALARRPRLRVSFSLDRERMLEGEEVGAELELESDAPIDRIDVLLVLPHGVRLVGGDNPRALRLSAERSRTLPLLLEPTRFGGYVLGELRLRARDPLGLFVYEQHVEAQAPLRVYPRSEHLRSLLPPRETQVFAGNQVARTKGEGIEFADLRPFAPGDRVRRVNWRASARRGSLWVTESHPERNADVVLFLDTFTEARRLGGDGTFELGIRAAATLAGRYLERRDRVGIVGFGGVLSWLLPASGLVHLYRVVDALVQTEITLNYAWKDVDVIPAGTLSPKALVLAISPLLDERATTALLDLRARGFDLAVVEVSPVPFASPGADAHDALAYRLWLLQRAALRARFRRAGVPVTAWEDGTPLAAPLEELAVFRRSPRFARV